MSTNYSSKSKEELLEILHNQGSLSSDATVQYHQAAAEKFGLNATDMKTLPLLTGKEPVSAGALAESLGLTTGAITTVVDRLEKLGLATRTTDPNDRRKVLVRTNPEGLANAYKIYEPMGRAMHELSVSYSQEELAIITDFMERSIQILERETRRLRQS